MNKRQDQSARSIASQINTIWLAVEKGLGFLCACILLTMAALTGADVIARYAFNAPIQGAFELTEVFLVCLVFCAMPLASRAGTHVEVELWEPASRFGRTLRMSLAAVSGTLIFAGLAYQLAEHGEKLAKRGSVTNSLDIPLSSIAYFAAGCCALTVGAVILAALREKLRS